MTTSGFTNLLSDSALETLHKVHILDYILKALGNKVKTMQQSSFKNETYFVKRHSWMINVQPVFIHYSFEDEVFNVHSPLSQQCPLLLE